jgi:RimJ/RimL family protein N-acetyltransferase
VNVELRTERLLMRPPEDADLEDLVALHDDPAMVRVFGDTTRQEMVDWIAIARRDWEERGHGRVVIRDRGDGAFLGRTGLRFWPEFGEVELGWSLTAAARGRGVATEAGRAWLDWGFRELDVPYFTSMIDPWNTASIAVAERLGMTRLRDDELRGEPMLVYAMRRA